MNTMVRLIVNGLSEQIQSETQNGINNLKPELYDNINTTVNNETENKINNLKPELYDNINATVNNETENKFNILMPELYNNINTTIETETQSKIEELINQIKQEIQDTLDNLNFDNITDITTDNRSLNDIKNEFCISTNNVQLMNYSYVFTNDILHIETPLYSEVDFYPLSNGYPFLIDNSNSYTVSGNEWGTGYALKINKSINTINIKIKEKNNNKLLYYLGTYNGEHYYVLPAYLNYSCIINGPNIFNIYNLLNLKKMYFRFNEDNSINNVSDSIDYNINSNNDKYNVQLLTYISSSQISNEDEIDIEIPLSSNILWFIDSFTYISYKYSGSYNFSIESNYLYTYDNIDMFIGAYDLLQNFNLPNELIGEKPFLRIEYIIPKEYFN